MVKVTLVSAHPKGLGPKEAAKAWYSDNSKATHQHVNLFAVIVGEPCCSYNEMKST